MKSTEEIILDAAAILEERGLNWFSTGRIPGKPLCPEAALNIAATGHPGISNLRQPEAQAACVVVASTYTLFQTTDKLYQPGLVSEVAVKSQSLERTLQRFRKAARIAAKLYPASTLQPREEQTSEKMLV